MSEYPQLNFDCVESYIARWHPDPDGDRQFSATQQGTIVAARWAAMLLDLPLSTVLRYRAKGLRYYEADSVAIRLGVHPSRLWRYWYGFEPDDPDDDDARRYWRTMRARALEESRSLRAV